MSSPAQRMKKTSFPFKEHVLWLSKRTVITDTMS